MSPDKDGSNLVRFIQERGYLDMRSEGSAEYYESALVLLGKIA